MVKITHALPEWQKNYLDNSSKTIPIEDILEAVGRSGEAEMIEKEADFKNQLTVLFGE